METELLDRIELHVDVPRMPHKDLADPVAAESSAIIRQRVEEARQIQRTHVENYGLHANSQMHIRRFCPVDEQGHILLVNGHRPPRPFGPQLQPGRTKFKVHQLS